MDYKPQGISAKTTQKDSCSLHMLINHNEGLKLPHPPSTLPCKIPANANRAQAQSLETLPAFVRESLDSST